MSGSHIISLKNAFGIVILPILLLNWMINQKTDANLSLILQENNLITSTLLSGSRQKFVLLVFKTSLS